MAIENVRQVNPCHCFPLICAAVARLIFQYVFVPINQSYENFVVPPRKIGRTFASVHDGFYLVYALFFFCIWLTNELSEERKMFVVDQLCSVASERLSTAMCHFFSCQMDAQTVLAKTFAFLSEAIPFNAISSASDNERAQWNQRNNSINSYSEFWTQWDIRFTLTHTILRRPLDALTATSTL